MPLYDFSLEIDPNEGFSDDKDIFGHKAFGERLTHLLANTNFPITLAIDAQWGEGKTTFLKMWAGHLRKEGFPVIEFDAFANDYYDDPFIPLAGEIVALAKDKGIKTAISDKAKKVGIALLKGAAKIGTKALTLNTLDSPSLEKIQDEIADGLADYAAKEVGELIDQYNSTKSEFQTFREALSELPDKLNTRPKHQDGHPINSKPLVFIIDELDRCRPDYALRLIERIKHFYSVKNVHFAFGAHISSIENSVNTTYGININSRLYLQKFFNVKLMLPTKCRNNQSSKISIYLNRIKNIFNFNFDFDEFEHYFISENVSLREIEKIFSDYSLIYRQERNENLNFYTLLLITIKIHDLNTFNIIIKDMLPIEKAGEIVKQLYPNMPDAPDWITALHHALAGSYNSATRNIFGIRLPSGGLNEHINDTFLNWEGKG